MRNRDDEFKAIAWPVWGVGAILIALIVLFAWAGAFGKTPPAGAPCLPPGVPALDTMTLIDRRVISIEGQRPTDNYMALERFYRTAAGAEYSITRLLGAFAVVDDEPGDAAATRWWVDPGLVTDGVPPRVQAVPASTCQWRRRADQT